MTDYITKIRTADGDMPLAPRGAELLWSGTAENVNSVKQDFDSKCYNNFCVVIVGTKAESAISITRGILYGNNTRLMIAYYTGFLDAMTGSNQRGSIVEKFISIGDNKYIADYIKDTNCDFTYKNDFQGNASFNQSPKQVILNGTTTTNADGIELNFSATIPSVSVYVYGY